MLYVQTRQRRGHDRFGKELKVFAITGPIGAMRAGVLVNQLYVEKMHYVGAGQFSKKVTQSLKEGHSALIRANPISKAATLPNSTLS